MAGSNQTKRRAGSQGGGGSGGANPTDSYATFTRRVLTELTDGKTSFAGTGLEQVSAVEAEFDNALLPVATGVTVYAQAKGQAINPTSGTSLIYQVEISLDGGGTWTAGTSRSLRHTGGAATDSFAYVVDTQVTGTVTGDIQARLMVSCSTGSGTLWDVFGNIALEVIVPYVAA